MLPLLEANFILPLKIDAELSYDDITVDVIRLNSIDFTESWAKGFMDLQKALTDAGVENLFMCNSEAQHGYVGEDTNKAMMRWICRQLGVNY